MNRFVIAEPSKCIGCRTCEVACALAHPVGAGGSESLTPENFKPRLKLVKSASVTAPVMCRHCENAPCVNSCPTEALIYMDGTVQLVAERCIGCQTCVIACPFGAMEMASTPAKQTALGTLSVNRNTTLAHKCDLCVDHDGGPACIPVCPTKAIYLVAPSGMESITGQRREQALAALSAAESR